MSLTRLTACGLALLALVTQQTAANSEVPAAAPQAAASVPHDLQVRPGFAGWGVISDVQHVEAQGAAAASDLLTIRMRDGSTRTSSGADAGSWKVGDRILLIG